MKLKKTIEEGITIAIKNRRELAKLEDWDIQESQEAAYWEGVREALDWVCGKREDELRDFVIFK